MSKRVFRSLTVLCLAIGLLFALALTANASDLTPDYYISGSPGAYAVGSSAGGTEIRSGSSTFEDALAACASSGTPVIQLGSATTPLSVNRGDGKLISATYTGALNIEYSSSTYGLQVYGTTVELRDFTLKNSLEGIGGEYDAVFVDTGGKLTIASGTNIIVKDGGVNNANPNALKNYGGTVTINGGVLLSIENKGRVITNYGTCTIGGNAEDAILISSSPLGGTGILNFTGGILTIGTGTTVSSNNGLLNYNTATISGGTLVSSNTTVNNNAPGTLYISGGTVRNTDTNGSSNALYNNSTAVVSGGVITSDSSCAIWTMYKLTLKGDCQVSAPNGTAVGSNTNTKAGSEINIGGNASITGKTTGVEASAATGTGGKGTSTLTITGGSISGNSYAVKTSADTEISGGTLSASGPSSTNSFALECSGGATVNISGGELIANSEQYAAYGIYNKDAAVNFSGGNVTATTKSSYGAYGIYNRATTGSATTNLSGGSITVKRDIGAPDAPTYGLHNNNATANITGGAISSEGTSNTSSAVYDMQSTSGKGIFISGTPVLKSASPYTVRLEKRSTDSDTLNYFGTSFFTNAKALVAIQGMQDDGDTYVIDSNNHTGAQAHALPDTGYGSTRWTSDAARTHTLSTANPAALSALTAGENTMVYLEVKPVFTVTVNSGANGTASANVGSAAAGDTVTLSATPNDGYRFKEWQVLSDGITVTDDQFIMPPANVSVKAIFEPDAFTTTVNVLCNARSIDAPGAVELKQGANTYPAAASAETGVYTATVPNGTYNVWINGEDTGKTVAINGAAAAVTVDYYSVIFSITNYGAAVGGSITATANGSPVAKYDCVLPGKTIVLTVNPSGAQTYTYLWTGNGMSEQTTQSVTFTLTDYVNAVCKVTGSATYNVTLNTNGGTINSGNITSYDYGTGATLPTDVTKTGFIFGGWYDNAGLIGSPVTAIGSTEKNAKTFWANWTAKTAIEYTPAVQSHTYGTTGASYTINYLLLTDFTVEYYVGSTWTTVAPTDAGSYDIRITRAEDATYASYDSGVLTNQFVITPAVLAVMVKPELTITKAFDEGASVDGVQSDWLIVSGLKNGETATASGTWSYDSVDAGTGKPVNITDISISYGTAESSNYSYTPVALSTMGTITNAAQAVTTVEIDYMAETVSTAAIMQYSTDNATWSDCSTNMVIDPSWFGGTVYFRYAKKPNYDAGAMQTLSIPARPEAPSVTGTNETSRGQGNGSISGLSAAMEYKIDTGSWTAATGTELTGLAAGTYVIRVKATESSFKSLEQEIILQNGPMLTVTFDGQGGTADSITDLSYDALISAPSPDPTRIGYTFAGWYKEATCTNAWDFETDKVTTNITLYAKWTADQYTITFNPGDGTVSPDSKMVTYDAAYGELPTPERTGYTFGGWWTDSDGTGEQVLASTSVTITASQTLYVKWTINQYTVTFSVNGGTAISPITQDYNTQIASVPSTVKPGYTFAGWFTDEGLTAGVSFPYTVADNTTLYAKWTTNDTDDDYTPPARTITVTETSSELFTDCAGEIQAEANMNNAFANSVEVKVTDTQEDKASFGFAAGDEVYPFDISLYIKGTNEKTEPAAGYTVTISLPVPQKMLDKRELLSVVHKTVDGVVTTLSSQLTQINGVWYLVFDATEFSPYALVVRSMVAYDESAGLPYYLNADESKIFIGFAANGKYIAPTGATIFIMHNAKSFTDVPSHWAAESIGFVSEREIFLGTGSDTFSPNAGMTRAMFATVIGRLYERSYGEIKTSDTHAFTDCNYGDYYGKYVDWAAENKIISGYGNGRFNPDDLITREQMAAILYRFVKFLGFLPNETDTVLSYPDSDSIAGYASDAALYCQTTGVISGRSGGIFAPQETATRAEVATIIQRFIKSVIE